MSISYPHPTNHLDAQDFGFTLHDSKENYSNRPSIYALLSNDEGKIASIKYREDIGRIYPLPGGGVNEGEDWEAGLMRELNEEIGCTITDIKPIGSFDSYDNVTMKCFQSIICTAKLSGELKDPESVEDYEQGAKLIWISREELIQKLEELAGPVDRMQDDRSFFTLKILTNEKLTISDSELFDVA